MEDKLILVLIGGGHACGKKTAAYALKDQLQEIFKGKPLRIDLKDMADYEKTSQDIKQEVYSSSKSMAITVQDASEMQFPPLKPSRFDFDRLKADIKASQSTSGAEILIVHGLYALYDKELRDMSNIKVFISSDADTRLIRWIRRDVVGGDESLETVINRYLQGARAEMSDFIIPTKVYSDVIMPLGPEPNAIKLLVDGISPYISKQESHTPHLRSGDLSYNENRSYYELN